MVDDVGTGRAATGVAEPLVAGKTFHDATGRMNTTIPAQISIYSKGLLKKIVHLRWKRSGEERTYAQAQSGNFASSSAKVSFSSSISPSPGCLLVARPTTLAVSSPLTSENASSSLMVWLSLSRVRREEAIEVVSSSRLDAEYTDGVCEKPCVK